MHVAVMGAGAIGSFYGARLAKGGARVTLIARGAHLDAIRTLGLMLEEDGRQEVLRLPATHDPAEVGPVDLVLVCVKSLQTEAAAEAIRPMVGPETLVLSLQNGVGNEEILARALGREHVAGGIALVYARLERPGWVRRLAGAGAVEIGELDGQLTPRIETVQHLFERAGLQCRVSRDLQATLWNKLIWNCALNGLTSLTGRTLDVLMASSGMRAVFRDVLEEAAAVARADGVRLPDDAVDRWMDAATRMGATRSSTLDDLESGRPLEVDLLNGEVVGRAERLGLRAPYNRLILETLRLMDTAGRST